MTDKEILGFITKFVKKNGWPPTVREIGTAVGLTSTSGVKARLDLLERSGRLIAQRNGQRTLKLEVIDAAREKVEP